MNGVMIPGVSAGSNHVFARETCTPHVSSPVGTAARAGVEEEETAPSHRTPTRPTKPIDRSDRWVMPFVSHARTRFVRRCSPSCYHDSKGADRGARHR